MKKYIKYIVLILTVGIIKGFQFFSEPTPAPIETTSTAIPPADLEKEKPFTVEKHPAETTKKIDHKLDSLLSRINKRHDFHGSILVAKNNKILYNNHVGYADFRKKTKLDSSSIFQLASVSKQFTAAAIMILYERNQLQLTDTINKYFPNFPYKNITIKHLLNHTSGLPKYFWVAEHQWDKKEAPSNMEMMDLLEKSNVYSFFKPGRNFDYSNTGYFVLASIVEKISGSNFSNFLNENIFTPLAMDNSFVYSCKNDTLKANQLYGYRLYRGWRHLKIGATVNDGVVGDKNVYTTSEDLCKWIVGLNSGKIISKENVARMYAAGETKYGRKVPYGFGFRLDDKKEPIIYHHGKWNGFSTSLTQYPEEELVVIILEHTSYNAINYLNGRIKKIVTENFYSSDFKTSVSAL